MKSIVVIQLKRIGDLVLTVPALAAVRQAYPAASITLVIDAGSAGLIPAIEEVDEVLIYQKNRSNLSIVAKLVCGHFDAALDFTGTDRSSVLTLFSGAARRVTFRQKDGNWLYSLAYHRLIDSPVREKHTIDRHLDLLTGIDVPPGEPVLHLALPESVFEKVNEILQAHSIVGKYIVIHAGAARAEKYWQPFRWAAVIDHCQTVLGRPCIVIGGDSPIEKEAVREIGAHCLKPFLDLTGQLDLMTSAALIAGAELFIGIDSGPSHLASAQQTPQITLFGPTNPFHWRARHPHSIVLQGGKENPLIKFDSRSPAGDLNALSTEEVIHAINLLLPTSSIHVRTPD